MKDLVMDHVLTVGLDEIDEDHSKLVNLVNILNHAVTEGATTGTPASPIPLGG